MAVGVSVHVTGEILHVALDTRHMTQKNKINCLDATIRTHQMIQCLPYTGLCPSALFYLLMTALFSHPL